MKNEPALTFQLKGKPTWAKVRYMLNLACIVAHMPLIDFRRASKTFIPIHLVLPCKDEMKIMKVKQFPLKDKRCKCGKHWFVRYLPQDKGLKK